MNKIEPEKATVKVTIPPPYSYPAPMEEKLLKSKKDNNPYTFRTTQVVITEKGKSLFNGEKITIKIEDNGGGEFLAVRGEESEHRFYINPEEVPAFCAALKYMAGQCREEPEEIVPESALI